MRRNHSRERASDEARHPLDRRLDHPREAEVVADRRKAGQPFRARILVRGFDALEAPVRSAENAHPAGPPVLVHHIHEFADRHLRIVAVHHVDVHVIRLKALQALHELSGEVLRRAERRMRALVEDDDLPADVPALDPLPEGFFALPVAVDPGGVEAVPAGREEFVVYRLRRAGSWIAPMTTRETGISIPGIRPNFMWRSFCVTGGY